MALLKIVSGDSAGAAFEIGAGSYRVGRAPGNQLQMPDGSVSGAHCEISLDSVGNLLVRDLGSTNGTFIQGQRVREAFVMPGQSLRLGNLELMFENTAAAVAATAAPAMATALNLPPPPVPTVAAVKVGQTAHAAPVVAAPTMEAAPLPNGCINHPTVEAVAICNKCGTHACNECTRKQKVGRKVMHFCPRCGGSCRDMGEVAKAAAVEAAKTKTFGQGIARSLTYPFRGNGVIILICGTIFFGLVDLFRMGILTWSLRVMLWGYLFAFMQRIIVTTAQGEDDPPEFPEVSDYHEDIVVPFRQLVITLLVSLAPAIFAFIQMGALAGQFALLLGALYFPMALLGVAMSDSFAALNPIFVLSAVIKCFGQYILTCIVFTGLMFVYYQFQFAAEQEFGFAGWFVFWFIFLVFLIIGMRILGMMYYFNKKKLGWGL
jgi:hypothetical protein